MFAREFAARAGAAKRRLGQIDLRLIRVFAAALTQAPGRLSIGPEREPFARCGQALSGFGRSRLRRQGQDLFGSPVHHSSRGVHYQQWFTRPCYEAPRSKLLASGLDAITMASVARFSLRLLKPRARTRII